MGQVDKIRMAASATEVETLVREGKVNFSDASQKTQRRWSYVAQMRLKELALAKEQKSVTEKKAEKAKKQ